MQKERRGEGGEKTEVKGVGIHSPHATLSFTSPVNLFFTQPFIPTTVQSVIHSFKPPSIHNAAVVHLLQILQLV